MSKVLYVSKSRLEKTIHEYEIVSSSVITWRDRMEEKNNEVVDSDEGESIDTYSDATSEYMNGDLDKFQYYLKVMMRALPQSYIKTKGLIARSEDFVNVLRGEEPESTDTYEIVSTSGDVASFYDNYCDVGSCSGLISDNTTSINELGNKEKEMLVAIKKELSGLSTIKVSVDAPASEIRKCIKRQNYTENLFSSLKSYCREILLMNDYVKNLRNNNFPPLVTGRDHNRSYNYNGAPTNDKESIYHSKLREMGYSEKDIEVLKRYTGLKESELYKRLSHMPATEVIKIMEQAYAKCGSDDYEENNILIEFNPNEVSNDVWVIQQILKYAGINTAGTPDGVFGSKTAQAIIEFQKKYGREFGLTICEFGENGELTYVDEKTLRALFIVAQRNTNPSLIEKYGTRDNLDLEGNTVVNKNDWMEWAIAQMDFAENIPSGKNEGDNKTPFGMFTNTDNKAWCASYVSWCLFMAGETSIPITASTAEIRGAAISAGTYRNIRAGEDYIPKVGDIFYRPRTGGGHVGFISSVTENGDGTYTIKTLEGNSGDCVCSHEYTLSKEEFAGKFEGFIEMDRSEKINGVDNFETETTADTRKED